jgi:hypothetical protein
MRKPGKDEVGKKKRQGPSLPGGGAAGRAYQFGIGHGIEKEGSENEGEEKSTAEELQQKIGGSNKGSKKAGRGSARRE